MTRLEAEAKVEDKNDIRDMAEVPQKSLEELTALKLIYPGMQQREALNAFRDLRAKLVQKHKGNNFVLLVSSLSAGGGGSFVAMNAAASFALDEGKTAIYIDCNHEHSFAATVLGGLEGYGLVDYLEDETLDAKDIIYSAGIPRVRVIPPGMGSDTSVERMASSRMRELISSLKGRYNDRFIVLDVPPVSESSLARILSSEVDLAVLVVPFGKVSVNQVLAGIDAVGEERFAGLVFNNE